MLPFAYTGFFIIVRSLVELSKSFLLLCDGIVVIDILYGFCYNVNIKLKIKRRYIWLERKLRLIRRL
jgi:hypothetical protein